MDDSPYIKDYFGGTHPKTIKRNHYTAKRKFGLLEKDQLFQVFITKFYPSGYVKDYGNYNPDGSGTSIPYNESEKKAPDWWDAKFTSSSEMRLTIDNNDSKGFWTKLHWADPPTEEYPLEFIYEREIEYYE
jgi:hypothetical protein